MSTETIDILDFYRRKQEELMCVTAYVKECGIKGIVDLYLEKSGYATLQEESLQEAKKQADGDAEEPHSFEAEILKQYKMRDSDVKSVKAWSREYSAEEILEDYLEKSGYL